MRVLAGVVTLLAAASSARAADVEHPWSIGAGASLGAVISVGSVGAPFGSQYTYSWGSPSVSVIFERVVDPSTALVLGVTGAALTHSYKPGTLTYFNSISTTESSWVGAALVGGVRRELTDPEASFAVSVLASFRVGYSKGNSEQTSFDSNGVGTVSNSSQRAYLVGALGGIAVDKLLAERLTLRIAAQLISAGYSKSRYRTTGQPVDATSTDLDVRLGVDPSLELRLAF